MLFMLLFGLGVDENVVDEHNDKLVQKVHEDLIHEIHEISGGIGQSKRHDVVLIQPISGGKGSFWNVGGLDFQLMISSSKIYLGENSGSGELIKQVFYLG